MSVNAGGREAGVVLGEGERPGDAADVITVFGALVGGEVVVGDDVGDADPAAGDEDAVGLGDHAGLSTDRLITQLEIITSIVPAAAGWPRWCP